MTTPTVDSLVEDYLARLRSAAQRLAPDRREELVEGITEHLQAARAAGAAADEAAVRTLLDRLGEPEEIVAAASEDGAPTVAYGPAYGSWSASEAGAVPAAPGTGHEVAALVLLTVGSFIPLVGWLVGVVLLWTSTRWRVWEKVLATLVVPGGPGTVLFLGGLVGRRSCSASSSVSSDGIIVRSAETCSGGFPPGIGIPLFIAALVAPFLVAAWLFSRARARAAVEPPVWRAAPAQGRWGGLEIAAVALLSVGTFALPGVGPIVGLVLLWNSQRWTAREKGIATALASLPLLLLTAPLIGLLVVRMGQ